MNCMEVSGGHVDGASFYRRPGLKVWVLARLKQEVTAGGGELHLISSCASGRITRILLADICGFGPLYQGVAGRLREIMKHNVNRVDQTRSIQQMVEQLTAAAQHGGFAATLMATYFAPERSVALCNAGYPSPFLYRSSMREWNLLRQPLRPSSTNDDSPGVLPAAEFQVVQTRLMPGDMLLTCSNSLIEARGRNGQTIGPAALLERVQELDCHAPHQLPGRLLDEILRAHADNLNHVDSMIVLCQATESQIDWRDNVLAPVRLLGPARDDTRPDS